MLSRFIVCHISENSEKCSSQGLKVTSSEYFDKPTSQNLKKIYCHLKEKHQILQTTTYKYLIRVLSKYITPLIKDM